VTGDLKLTTNGGPIRVAATWIALAAIFGATVQIAQPAESLLTRVPVEFQGFWQTELAQCQSGREGWLRISDLMIREVSGTGTVVSVRYIATREIEIDMAWLSNQKGQDDGRKVGRLLLSEDGRRIIWTRDGNSLSRVRCE
jgi:hypothetical protein